jgi:hypothetical protein
MGRRSAPGPNGEEVEVGAGERSDMTSSSVRGDMFCEGMGRNVESVWIYTGRTGIVSLTLSPPAAATPSSSFVASEQLETEIEQPEQPP